MTFDLKLAVHQGCMRLHADNTHTTHLQLAMVKHTNFSKHLAAPRQSVIRQDMQTCTIMTQANDCMS